MMKILASTPILVLSLLATLGVGASFQTVMAAAGEPLLDFLMSGAAASERLDAMSNEAKTAHFWGTVLNDTAYPLAYGALFAGLAFRFGSQRILYGLPALTAVVLDLAENTVQALALSGTVDVLWLKSGLTPLKFGMVALAAGLALILIARAVWREMIVKRGNADV
ncbi:MAG: hypothetical protein AAGJ85_01790 [Pseudomonadota bacterium]